jgi:segregation and condensation protein A
MPLTDRPIHELVGLVRDNKLDPWDVDIEKLTSMYLEKIRLMKEFDIRIPARVLLSAALLLQMKSAYALNGDGRRELEEELEELLDMDIPDIGEITLVQFVPRKITLEDLLSALKDALLEIPEKRERPGKRFEKVVWRGEDLDAMFREYMSRLHERIKALINSGLKVTLMNLVEERTKARVTLTFLLLLFLCSEGKVRLEQPEPFGDIFVRLSEGKPDGNSRG